MSQRPKALAQRRAALVARGEARRTEVAAAVMAMRERLSFIEGAVALATKVKRQPVMTGAVFAGLAALLISPRRSMQWISYAATAYSLARRLRSLTSPNRP